MFSLHLVADVRKYAVTFPQRGHRVAEIYGLYPSRVGERHDLVEVVADGGELAARFDVFRAVHDLYLLPKARGEHKFGYAEF